MLSAGEIASMRGTLDQLTNATLLKIENPDSAEVDEYGESGEPVAVWTGRADGYLERQDHQEISGGQEVDVEGITFRLLDDAGAPVLAEAGPNWSGSTIVLEDRRLDDVVTSRFSVIGMEHEANGLLDSVLLTLDSETAVA